MEQHGPTATTFSGGDLGLVMILFHGGRLVHSIVLAFSRLRQLACELTGQKVRRIFDFWGTDDGRAYGGKVSEHEYALALLTMLSRNDAPDQPERIGRCTHHLHRSTDSLDRRFTLLLAPSRK